MSKASLIYQIITKTKLTSQKNLTKNIFKEIKSLSRTEGGFLDNNNRKELWKIILNTSSRNKKMKYLKIDSEMKPHFDYLNWKKYEEININSLQLKSIKEIETIKKDFPREQQYKQIERNNQNIDYSSLIYLYDNQNFNYLYYQGCLSLFYYFVHLYPENNHFEGINMFQRFSEIFLKDFLLNLEVKIDEKNKETSISTVKLLISNFLLDVSKECYLFLKEHDLICFELIVEWILCCFTHSISDEEKSYRILDFIICHNKIMVYIMVSFILKNRIIKFCKSNNVKEDFDDGAFFKIIYEKTFNQEDFEDIIGQSYQYYKANKSRLKVILNKQEELKQTLPYTINGKIKGTLSIAFPEKKKKSNWPIILFIVILFVSFLIYIFQ